MRKSNNTLLGLYRLMMVTRTLDKVIGAFQANYHALEGEEGTVAGVYFGLRRDDMVVAHYRGMLSAAYAKGADLRKLLGGNLGKSTDYTHGRCRTEICGPAEFNVFGLYSGTLGVPLGYAVGAALAAKMDQRDNVAVGVFGDGTSNRGDCHESMNMAAAMRLPIVFVCQNNQMAVSTRAKDMVCGSIAARGTAIGIPSVEVDGNDVLTVHEAMQTAVAAARAGEGPSLVECVTYRMGGHQSRSPWPDLRDPKEINEWREKDPVNQFRAFLIGEGVLDKAGLDLIDSEVEEEVNRAADQADEPSTLADLGVDQVYA